jgi:isoleucyl-tRNA synthetase
MATHAAIKVASERARSDKVLGSSLQCSVILEVPQGKALSSLIPLKDELETMFVVSSVDLNETVPQTDWAFSEAFDVYGSQCLAWILPPKQAKCPRCWRYVAPVEDQLCDRCEDVVAGIS